MIVCRKGENVNSEVSVATGEILQLELELANAPVNFLKIDQRLNNCHLPSPIPKFLAWGRRRDSNPQPTESQSVDLTN